MINTIDFKKEIKLTALKYFFLFRKFELFEIFVYVLFVFLE